MDISLVWKNLEEAISRMDDMQTDYTLSQEKAWEAIKHLFDYPVETLFEQVERSRFPTNSLVLWLAYEGKKMDEIPLSKIQDLIDCWQKTTPKND